MTFEIAFVLGLILLAFILFVTEKFSLDVTALLILTILFVCGFLSIDEAISGFENPDKPSLGVMSPRANNKPSTNNAVTSIGKNSVINSTNAITIITPNSIISISAAERTRTFTPYDTGS